MGEVIAEAKEKEGVPHIVLNQHPRPGPTSATKEVLVCREHLKIDTTHKRESCTRFLQLLERNEGLFTKEIRDLKRISRQLVEHILEVTPKAHPIRPKLHPQRGERREEATRE